MGLSRRMTGDQPGTSSRSCPRMLRRARRFVDSAQMGGRGLCVGVCGGGSSQLKLYLPP